jgi:predicted ATPase
MVSGMLLERETELGVLGELIANLDSTGGRFVLIRGEAGIGKSALVQRFVDSNEAEAFVHLGTCDDLFIPQPLGPFWDMARADPSLRRPLEDGDRPDHLGAVLSLTTEGETPTLFVHEARPGAFDASPRLQEIAGRFRETLPVRISDSDNVLDADRPTRVLLADGVEHRITGDRTVVHRPGAPPEERRMPLLDRGLRRAVIALRRAALQLRSRRR